MGVLPRRRGEESGAVDETVALPAYAYQASSFIPAQPHITFILQTDFTPTFFFFSSKTTIPLKTPGTHSTDHAAPQCRRMDGQLRVGMGS